MAIKPTQLYVRSLNPSDSHGFLCIGHRQFPCLLGKNGTTFFKREGDGKSPKGCFALQVTFYRPDKMIYVKNGQALRKTSGWCDDRAHANYNRAVTLPFSFSHERLWREDEAYDIIVTTSQNQRPRVKGTGSAIFLHAWQKGAIGTEGCIALREGDLRKVLSALGKEAYLVI